MAAYRDPELLPTLNDCISKAKYPENLRFGITWQHSKDDKWDTLDKYKTDNRFKIIDKDYKQSKGACWARNLLQDLYDGETYTLQLDSHHRFTENWDESLINMLKDLQSKGYKKPLITSYIPSYNPENDPEDRVYNAWILKFDKYIPEGAVFTRPQHTNNKDHDLSKPMLGRFYSAHFAFTLGQFAKEVKHDPNYYFHGEEISIAVRAFTHGYDIFYPHKVIAWHEYTLEGRTKQWDDDKEWVDKNVSCHKRNRKLFGMDGETQDIDFGEYGFGSVRSLRDYEKYAGLQFATRSITQDVLDNNTPNFENMKLTDEEFEASLLNVFNHVLNIPINKLTEKDYDFWCIAFKDENNKEMYREDANKEEIGKALQNSKDGICHISRSFETIKRPTRYVILPHSVKHGWCKEISESI